MDENAVATVLSSSAGRQFVFEALLLLGFHAPVLHGEHEHQTVANAATCAKANLIFNTLMSQQPELALEMLREAHARTEGEAP